MKKRTPAAAKAAAKVAATIIFAFICNFSAYAQQAPYLVPSHIYVGDPATLVMRLPAAAENSPDLILSNESFLPSHESLDINKITLEKRTTGSRLLIEFTAFAPGTIEFPVIEIGGEYFSGLTVNVDSLVEGNSARHLSGAASALAMPGTAMMLYGLMAVLVVIILLAIWFIFKGRVVIKQLRERWRRYRLFAGMLNTEKKLERALAKGADKRIILDKLSFEFREFLSILTEKNCRSMTARDFMREFIKEFENADEVSSRELDESAFLGEFFGRCDKLRFSGTDIDIKKIVRLLDDLKEFIESKSKEEKAK